MSCPSLSQQMDDEALITTEIQEKLSLDDAVDNDSTVLGQIAHYINDELQPNEHLGIQWLENIESLVQSLPEETPHNSFHPNWANFLLKVEEILKNAKPFFIHREVRLDTRIYIIHRCLTLLRKLNLDSEFISHCESNSISSSFPSVFLKEFARAGSTIKGWSLIPQIFQYVLQPQTQLFEKINQERMTFFKIRKKETDFQVSLIFCRKKTENKSYFNVYVTRTQIGSGGLKRVKDICSLSRLNQSKAKLTPKYKPNKNEPLSCIKANRHSQLMIKEGLLSQDLCNKKIPHILQMQVRSFNGKAILLSDLCEKKDLEFYRKEFPPESQLNQLIVLIKESLETLKALHKNNLCHLDVKFQNILVFMEKKTPHIRISDLTSVSEVGGECQMTTFFSPEMVRLIDEGKSNEIKASPHIDMWNIGLILFALRTGKDLLSYKITWTMTQSREDRSIWFENINRLIQDFEALKDSSSTIDILIEKLLSYNPADRPTAQEALKVIEQYIETLQNKK